MKQIRLKFAGKDFFKVKHTSSNCIAGMGHIWMVCLILLLTTRCSNPDGTRVSTDTVRADIAREKNGGSDKSMATTGKQASIVCSCPSTGHVPGCAAVEFFPVKKARPLIE